MSEGKKGKQQLSPTKRGATSFEEGESKELFPELPPFFVDINQLLKDDPLIRAYEREYLYEQERDWAARFRKEIQSEVFSSHDENKELEELNKELQKDAALTEVSSALGGSLESIGMEANVPTTNTNTAAGGLPSGGITSSPSSPNPPPGVSSSMRPHEIDSTAGNVSHYTDPFASEFLTSAYFSKSWQDYQHKPCEMFETVLKNDIAEGLTAMAMEKREQEQEIASGASPAAGTAPTQPSSALMRGDRDKTAKVVKEFHQLFPLDDILIRESEQQCAVELFCEGIAKEIVNQSAECYISRCFEAIKEGYTAHSVWEELRDSVAHAFLPQDYHQLPLCPWEKTPDQSKYFGYVGDTVDRNMKQKRMPYAHHFMGQDVPSSLLLSAAVKVKLSASQSLTQLKQQRAGRYAGGRNAVDQNPSNKIHIDPSIGAGTAPDSVPIDEYCRYILPIVAPSPVCSREPSTMPSTGVEIQRPPPPERENTAAAHPSRMEKENTGQFHGTSPKMKTPARPKPKKPAPSHSVRSLSVSSVKHDDLTTALKNVPHSYFNQRLAAALENATEGDDGTPRKSGGLTARPPVLDFATIDGSLAIPTTAGPVPPSQQGTRGMTGRRSARGERHIPLVNIEGDKVLVARDVEKETNRNLASKKKPRGEEGTAGGEHKPVTLEVIVPGVPEEEVVDNEAASSKNRPAPHHRLLPEESKKVAERKRQKELQEQREREKLFVIPLQQPEEIQNHIEVRPEPGVQVQRPPTNAPPPSHHMRPGPKVKKDEPQVVADGGEYIISENKQRWTDSSKGSSNTGNRQKSAEENKKGTVLVAQSNRANQMVSKMPIIDAKQKNRNALSSSRSFDKVHKREIRRNMPKVMRKGDAEFAAANRSGRVVVAQSSHKSQERLPMLPYISPSRRLEEESLQRHTKRSSLTEQERLSILTSALNTI